MDRVLLSHDPIDVAAAYASVQDPRCGGIALFVGTTRDTHEGRQVELLAYEAYEAMALKELEALVADIHVRWPDVVHACIVHRLGEVPLGEASVLVAVSTPHRVEAFAACRHGIDALKASVPIWKKESYRDGADPRWVANRESAVPGEQSQVQP
jgi:molybdopterin synthase catalytic subunit